MNRIVQGFVGVSVFNSLGDIYLGVDLLSDMVILCLTFCGTAILFHRSCNISNSHHQ